MALPASLSEFIRAASSFTAYSISPWSPKEGSVSSNLNNHLCHCSSIYCDSEETGPRKAHYQLRKQLQPGRRTGNRVPLPWPRRREHPLVARTRRDAPLGGHRVWVQCYSPFSCFKVGGAAVSVLPARTAAAKPWARRLTGQRSPAKSLRSKQGSLFS